MNNKFSLFLLVQAFNKLILHPDKSKIILSHTSQKNFNFQSFYQYWLEKKEKLWVLVEHKEHTTFWNKD